MYKEKLLELINSIKPNLFSKKIISYPEILNDIINKTSFLNSDTPLLYRCIFYINNITQIPLCKICNQQCNSIISKSYSVLDLIKNPTRLFYCSEKCYRKFHFKEAFKNTCLNKYGCVTNLQTEETKEKIKQTNLLKYGVTNPSQNEDIKLKKENTYLNKYGVKNPFQLLSNDNRSYNIEKTRSTCLEKYGVEHPSQNEDIKKKTSETLFRKIYSNPNSNSDTYIIDPFDVYYEHKNDKSYLFNWRCKKCNNTFTRYIDGSNYLPNHSRCPYCYPKVNGYSNMEKEIVEYIKSYCNDDIIEDSFGIIPPQQLDIYIPSKNLAIEFDGLYWHSYTHLKDYNYHLNKTAQCDKNGIRLIHIFEDEWLYKKDIVKSRIKNLIGLCDKKIYARNCIIKEVDSKTTREFIDNNHIQGYSNSKYNIGLYYNDELISIMTFGNYRKSMGKNQIDNEYEMIRFCCKLNYSIIGGASKLLKYFIKAYKPIKIISYCDRRWSNGNLYYKLGFTLDHISKPNYWYIINSKRFHRFKYRKSELHKLLENFNSEKSEWENMMNNGYDKIYDCGNYVFQLKI